MTNGLEGYKLCKHCACWRPLDQFSNNRAGLAGKNSICRTCRSKAGMDRLMLLGDPTWVTNHQTCASCGISDWETECGHLFINPTDPRPLCSDCGIMVQLARRDTRRLQCVLEYVEKQG